MRAVSLILVIMALAACGSSNGQAPTTTNAHESRWLTKHDQKAQVDLVECRVCHEMNLAGNGHVPGCQQCHTFGMSPFVIHPPLKVPALGWAHPTNHGGYAKEDISKCQGCHAGLGGGAGSNPRFNVALGDLEQGCESALGCHNNTDLINSFNNGHNPRAAHPAKDTAAPYGQDQKHWYGENIVYQTTPGGPLTNYNLNHTVAGNQPAACALCHGATLKGTAEGGVGPACMNCHVLDPIANPTRCVSCHGPMPGQQQDAPLKPAQLAVQAGRPGMVNSSTFQAFSHELTGRMKQDPSYIKITPQNPRSAYYFAPSAFFNYSTSITNLSKRSSHLSHDTLSCSDRQNNDTCSSCHTANRTSNLNFIKHHSLMSTRGLGCVNCHYFTFGPNGMELAPFRNCRDCHTQNFCN